MKRERPNNLNDPKWFAEYSRKIGIQPRCGAPCVQGTTVIDGWR